MVKIFTRVQSLITYLRPPAIGHGGVESLLYGFSLYLFPILIIVVSLIAISSWSDNFSSAKAQPLEFRYFEQIETPIDPETALLKLKPLSPTQKLDSILHESSFWFLIAVPPTIKNEDAIVDFPSRHVREIICWDTAGLIPIGFADRNSTSGHIRSVKAGFSIGLGQFQTEKGLLCKAKFAGSPIITFDLWPASGLEKSIKKFHRDSGLLEGGLMMLVIFSLVAAAINRELLYLLFSLWLIATLRVASISAGWDMQWLGHIIPGDWLLPLRKITFVAYYTLTVALFSKLFSTDLRRTKYSALLTTSQVLSLPLFGVAIALPYTSFLPWLWAFSGFTIAVLLFLLIRITKSTQSRVALLYGSSVAIILISSISEVVAAAFGQGELLGVINHVTGALLSSLVVALAIAEHLRQERQEKITAQTELKHTYDAIPIGLFTLDEQGLMLSSNPALQYILNIPSSSAEGARNWRNYFDASVWEHLSEAVRTNGGCDMEVQYHPRENGGSKWLQIKATFSQGRIEGSLQDVTVRHIATEKLKRLANHDSLTGVFNRRGIESALRHAIESLPPGESIMVGYLDLDRFKLINDLYGHVAGDDVLKQVCRRLLDVLSDDHKLGRIGGDEFIILFKNGSVHSAETICERALSELEKHAYLIGEKEFQVKASIGLVELTGNIQVKDAISAADRACREAKRGLQGHLLTYEKTASVFRERESELAMIERFSSNRAPDGLFLEMQPIMSLREPYASHNFETLIRLREPDGRIIPAGLILSAAESNGNSGIIDRWVLNTLLQWLDVHLAKLQKTRFVCMNLSGASLNDERFIQDAFSILSAHSNSASQLCIEITEDVALNDLAMTRRFIDGVKKYDAKIALDDFGAGYTSFSYLRELPADAIKIDGSFVRDVCRHPTNLSIVATIADLARNLGMKSIAEWAEDLPTVEALAEVGIDYVQGWAIAKSQSAENILRADSSADLILDETMAKFVRENLPAKSQTPGFFPFSMH